MRISDWSSDVCSSDLQSTIAAAATSSVLIAILGFSLRNVVADVFAGIALSIERPYRIGDWVAAENGLSGRIIDVNWRSTRLETRDQVQTIVPNGQIAQQRRSEEHTSELQSLMRISYAVFCLKKK